MNWMEQSLEMMKSWSDMQKKMWDGWMAAATDLGTAKDNPMDEWTARWQDTMKKSMDVWEDLVRTVVDAESKWTTSEAASSFWPGREDDVKKMMKVWADQTSAMMKSWTDAQRTLWDSWYGMASSAAKSAQSPANEWFERWQTTTRDSMKAWEDLSRTTMEKQADWLKTWTTAAEAGKKTGASAQE
jgi:hypothetical protein